ncbi:MAG: helix-turn-helix domain-containing protein [Muribaculaceae bacterium]|nr:helix-turn-helix domain-containing protein [Muribaculaceae bacterium]
MTQDLTTVKLDSIDAYNKLYGLETLHPLVTVINLTEATRSVNNICMDYGVYALYLKRGVNCTLKYGRQPYDYQEGSVVSFAPGQLISVTNVTEEVAPDVIGLMFHPDLIYGTPLAAKIKSYSFFDYSQREAVHLSTDERHMFVECLDRIKAEISHPVDRHTAEIVTSHIQVLLDYMTRFYERQFITRHKINSDMLSRFITALKEYYAAGHSKDGIPTVNHFAEVVNLSPGYFGDLVKKETGKTAQEIISLQIIESAKDRLTASDDDISIIAYDLGFQYPQHFSRMFRRITGISPSQFRDRTSRRHGATDNCLTR